MGPKKQKLRVLVLAGGPDRERAVSLQSGASVAAALAEAGHEVTQRDIGPNDLSALDEFAQTKGDVVFPVLHGPWGEGGPMQEILERRGLRFVGCRAEAARLCMDKHRTKQALASKGVPTPEWQLLPTDQNISFRGPIVIKPNDEGSSIDLYICKDAKQVSEALAKLRGKYEKVLAEQFITGVELTVGVIGTGAEAIALPPIRIVPATEFYDYQAKYVREDTQYLLDPRKIGLDAAVLEKIKATALQAHRVTGCRHLSRVDFMVDGAGELYVLEINTLPGFTTHSLVPKAAAAAGIPMPALVDRLVRMAWE